MPPAPPSSEALLAATLEHAAARSLLLVGPGLAQCYARIKAAHPAWPLPPEAHIHALEPSGIGQQLAALGRFDLVWVADTLEHLEAGEAMRLIARLRDLHSARLYLALAHDAPPLAGNDLLALGFSEVPVSGADPSMRLYRHALYDYKHTPDWLNPKHWAHPQRWGKYRW